MICYEKKILKNVMLLSALAFFTISQALVGRRSISVEYENNFYYVLMTYIMACDK